MHRLSTVLVFLALILPLGAQEKVSPLPCFPEAGDPVLSVEGVPVPAATIARFAAIMKARTPSLSDEAARRKGIEEGIIPQAGMYARHKANVAAVSAKAATIAEALKGGGDFAALARTHSDDPTNRATGGEFQTPFARAALPGLTPLSPSMEDVVFKTPVGGVAGPFVTPVGVHFVRVLKEVPNAEPRYVQRHVAHILLHFDAEYAKLSRELNPAVPNTDLVSKLQERAKANRRAIRQVRVKVLHEDYRGLLFPYRIAKDEKAGG